MSVPVFPALVYKHRGLAADQHLTQDEWNQVGVEVQALEEFYEIFMATSVSHNSNISGGPVSMGGLMLPRSVLDARMPNARWYASAYFWASAPASITTTIDFIYTKDDYTNVFLGTLLLTAGSQLTNVKRSFEPVEITTYKEADSIISLRMQWTVTGGSLTIPGGATIVLTGKRRT